MYTAEEEYYQGEAAQCEDGVVPQGCRKRHLEVDQWADQTVPQPNSLGIMGCESVYLSILFRPQWVNLFWVE